MQCRAGGERHKARTQEEVQQNDTQVKPKRSEPLELSGMRSKWEEVQM